MKLRVTQFSRFPAESAFSIERVFNVLRAYMPGDIIVEERRNRFLSRGILPRLLDSLYAFNSASEVNHITGDVHYLAYFLPKARTILTIHDTVVVERSRGLKRFLLWLLWYWLPIKRAGWITTISEESKRRILSLVACEPDRIQVVPNPVDPSFIPQASPPQIGDFRILHIGTKPNKNLERLVCALGGLSIELTVIGDLTKHQKQIIEERVPKHRLLGRVSDRQLHSEYARSHCLAFISLEEGFGLPILEAQAVGRPVVTSSKAPMDAVSGGAACLVDPEDIAQIREAFCRLMADSEFYQELIDEGRRNVSKYSPLSISAQYASLYRAVAASARRK